MCEGGDGCGAGGVVEKGDVADEKRVILSLPETKVGAVCDLCVGGEVGE